MSMLVITDGECTLYANRNEDEMHAIYDRLLSSGKPFTALIGERVSAD